ncbi:MAG: leucine-rich repeat domain-containing protein [Muribaculaceae bacterium]|nr:leucine-rich repeat domain-containing protein [Muribaculaceae bacterium]
MKQVIMLITVVWAAMAAVAEKPLFDFKDGGIGYTILDEAGQVSVTDLRDAYEDMLSRGDGTITVPGRVTDKAAGADYSVVRIGKGMFCGMNSLRRVVLPDGLISISRECFDGNPDLEEVVLGNSLKEIWGSFANLPMLKSIKLPETLESIGASFGSCALEEVLLPASVKTISLSFKDMPFLKRIDLSQLAPEVGINTFSFVDCTQVAEIVFPETMDVFSEGCFTGMESLEELHLPKAPAKSLDFWCNGSNFTGCPSLKRIYNPNIVPPQVYSLDYSPWDRYENVFIADVPTAIGVDKAKCVLCVPDGSVAEYRADASWRQFQMIEGYVPASVDGVAQTSRGRMYVSDGKIVFEDYAGETVGVFAADGRVVFSGAVRDVSVSLSPGLYIVTSGGISTKIVL